MLMTVSGVWDAFWGKKRRKCYTTANFISTMSIIPPHRMHSFFVASALSATEDIIISCYMVKCCRYQCIQKLRGIIKKDANGHISLQRHNVSTSIKTPYAINRHRLFFDSMSSYDSKKDESSSLLVKSTVLCGSCIQMVLSCA